MSNSKEKIVCIIGPLPPPVHGLSAINQLIIDKILKIKKNIIILDTSAKSLIRGPINIVLRFFKMIKTIIHYATLLMFNRIEKSYMSLSGGFGQVYDLFIVVFSRFSNTKLYIHHHSFAYLNKKSILTNLIINIAKNDTTHIVLCERMGELLKKYNSEIIISVISNSAFIPNQISPSDHINENGLKIGFLSNVSFEKGIKEFIDTLDLLSPKFNINGFIAGSYSENESKQYLENKIQSHNNITYFGSVDSNQKKKFFEEIDILLFPTNYVNEAEPLVIHEAMSFGVPVIARSRGCIKQIINDNHGIIITNGDDFALNASRIVKKLISNPSDLNRFKLRSYNAFNNIKNDSLASLENLINELV